MKDYKLIVLIGCVSLLMVGCSPDLVISTFQTAGSPTVNQQGSVEVPIRVVVKNQGDAEAGIFKVSTHFTDVGGSTYMAAFTVPGQSDIWCPYTSAPLAAGSEISFTGKVIINHRDETVDLKGKVDSCSGDEFKPDYCRVNESNEGNNESTSIKVKLP